MHSRIIVKTVLLFFVAACWFMEAGLVFACEPAPSGPVLLNDIPMEQAPFKIRLNGSEPVFSCVLPEYCAPVDIYAAFLSPSGRIYFPDSEGNLGTEPQVFKTDVTGPISEIFRNTGHVFTFGTWQIYWYISPAGTGTNDAYEFGSSSVVISNGQEAYSDENCPITKPEYSVDTGDVEQILEIGREYFESLVDPVDRQTVLDGVLAYPEGSTPLKVSVNDDGVAELDIQSRAAAFYVAGVEAFLQNSKDVSTWCFLESAVRDPSHAASLNNAAFNFFQYGVHEPARILLLYAKSLAPNYNPVNVNLGYVLYRLGKYREAAYFYQTAWFNDMGNPDYLRLVIHSLEKIACSENILEFYHLLSPEAVDSEETSRTGIASFDTGVNEPVLTAMKLETRSKSEAYEEVKDWIRTIEDESQDDIKEFLSGSLDPVLQQLFQAMLDCPMICSATGGDACEYNICVTGCLIGPVHDVRAEVIGSVGRVYNEAQSAVHQVESMIFSYHDALTPEEYDALLVLAQNYRNNINNSYRQILTTMPSANMADKLQNLIDSGCESNPGTQALLVIFGEENVSFEPEACFMILCVSMDHEGMGAIQVSALVVNGKLGVNPFTGDTLIQFGIGPGEVGVGPVTAELSLYLKIEGNEGEFERIGLQPTVGVGPLEVGYYFGLERVSNP